MRKQYTPGPWLVMGNQRKSGHFDFVLPEAKNEDFQANCKLIAAAPDMLEALQEAERGMKWMIQESKGRIRKDIVGGFSYHADKIAEAIAKATK